MILDQQPDKSLLAFPSVLSDGGLGNFRGASGPQATLLPESKVQGGRALVLRPPTHYSLALPPFSFYLFDL